MICRKLLLGLGIGLATLVLAGCEQWNVDAQMEALCKQDGGIKVVEKVVLPRDQFTPQGDPKLFVSWNNSDGDYFFTGKTEQIKKTSPTIDKTTYSIIRESDNKVLATYVAYLRKGGDILPRLGPDSARSCPEFTNSRLFIRAVFVSKE